MGIIVSGYALNQLSRGCYMPITASNEGYILYLIYCLYGPQVQTMLYIYIYLLVTYAYKGPFNPPYLVLKTRHLDDNDNY